MLKRFWQAGLYWVAFLAMLGMASFPATGQDDVAGAPPVFSRPKKDLSKIESQVKDLANIRIQSDLVVTPVSVLDSSGEFVYDLNEDDFQILDNGVPQRIEHFETEMRTVAAVVVVQTSDSVAPLLDQVRKLGAVFSGTMLGAQGQASVIFFDDRVRMVEDFSNEGERLAATLRGVTGGGDKARLSDALARAVDMLARRPKGERRVIVAFSDGYDSGSETKAEEVVQRATDAEVAIYGLGFNPVEALLARKPQAPPPSPLDTNVARPLPPGTVRTPTHSENVYSAPIPVVPIVIATGEIIRSAFAASLLELYAGYTGGVYYKHWSEKALERQLNRVASEIQSQYELAYVPDTPYQPGFHRIEVRVKRPGVKVRARAGYFFPEKTPETP